MKKSTKLLSVLLAVLMVLSSVSVLAFAAPMAHKTVADLENRTDAEGNPYPAYDEYGRPTRLTTEERMSLTFDLLDFTLGKKNIAKPDMDVPIVGIIHINLTSVNELCKTLDGVIDILAKHKDTFGDVGTLVVSNWTPGMSRETNAQLDIMTAIFNFLKDNATPIANIIKAGNIKLGFLVDVITFFGVQIPDMHVVGEIPNKLKGKIFPLFARWDDDKTRIDLLNNIGTYSAENADRTKDLGANVTDVLNAYVEGMLTRNVSIANYKEDAQGNMVTGHKGMPVYPVSENPGNVFKDSRVIFTTEGEGANKVFYRWSWDSKHGQEGSYVRDKDAYARVEEKPNLFRYQNAAGANLEWYLDDTPALHTMYKPAGTDPKGQPVLKDGIDMTMFNLKTRSGAEMLYFVLPYLFKDMAIIPANGSLKMEMAQFFGASFPNAPSFTKAALEPLPKEPTAPKEPATEATKKAYEAEKAAYDKAVANKAAYDKFITSVDATNQAAAKEFVKKEQETFIWEYSDYAVYTAAGKTQNPADPSTKKDTTVHIWRFEDDFYVADLSNTNPYFDIVDWNYRIPETFIDRFMPVVNNNGKGKITYKASAAGYKSIFHALNDFVYDVVNLVLDDNYKAPGKDVSLQSLWTAGNNTNLVKNARVLAQAVLKVSPESIFGSNYADPDRYYDLIMTDGDTKKDVQTILVGVACTLIDLLMPQLALPSAESLRTGGANKGLEVGALLAAVVRELATQFVPEKNYDAWIYSKYEEKTFLTGKDNKYWTNVIFNIGTDIAMKYILSVCDLGPQADLEKGMKWTPDKKAYNANEVKADKSHYLWEARLDYIIDWACCDKPYGFNMANILNTGFTAAEHSTKLTEIEDPFAKLQSVVDAIIVATDGTNDHIKNVLNIDTSSTTWLKTNIMDNLINMALTLDLTTIFGVNEKNAGTFNIPETSPLKQANLLGQVTLFVRDLLDNILARVTRTAPTKAIPVTITDIDQLFENNGLGTVLESLLKALADANTNGIFDPLLPFAVLFAGPKVTGQTYEDAPISVATRVMYDSVPDNPKKPENGSHVENEVLISNEIGGLLLKHTKADGTAENDQEYVINLTSVTTDSSIPLTGPSLPLALDNMTCARFTMNGAYTHEPYTITVKYTVTKGIDGQQVGDEQSYTYYGYMARPVKKGELTAAAEDAWASVYEYHFPAGYQVAKHQTTGGKWLCGVHPYPTQNYYIAHNLKDIDNVLNSVGATFGNHSEWRSSGDKSTIWATGAQLRENDAIVALDTSMFVHYPAGKTVGGFKGDTRQGILPRDEKDTNSWANKSKIYPIRLNPSADLSRFQPGEEPFIFNLGKLDINWFNSMDVDWKMQSRENPMTTKDTLLGEVYFLNDGEINAKFNEWSKIQRSDFSEGTEADTAWNAFVEAMKAVSEVTLDPFSVGKWDAKVYKQSNYKTLMQNVQTQLDILNQYKTDKGLQTMKDALAAAEKDAVGELNYTDYDLYEFFQYQSDRNDIRWRIDQYNAPDGVAHPYIASNRGLAWNVLDKAQKDAQGKYADAILESLTQPTQEETDAAQKAKDNWRAPSFSDADNKNLATTLQYKQRHLKPLTSIDDFLKDELTIADNILKKDNGTEEAPKLYSWRTWTALQDKVAEAKKLFSNGDTAATSNALKLKKTTTRHEIFDAKYELMVAVNALVPVEKSCDVQGYYDALNAAIETATGILNSPEVYAAKPGVENAWGKLITALGYETANGTQLYPNSAMAFVATDKIYSKNEGTRINERLEALKAAIANFECQVKLVPGANGAKPEEVLDYTDLIIKGLDPTKPLTNPTQLAAHVTTFVPESIDAKQITEKITLVNGVFYGTGATVELSFNNQTFAKYTVVIYGDVNGDSTVDAFDVALTSQALEGKATLTGACKTAANVNKDADFAFADYNAIVKDAAGVQAINQN